MPIGKVNIMKKVSIGSWAFVFQGEMIMLPELCEKLHELKFDGVSMGGFKPHANPDTYDTEEKRAELKALLKKYDLEVADFACDLWSLNSISQADEWVSLFKKNAEFAEQMGWKYIRVDSGAPPVLPEGMTYEQARKVIVDNFKRAAKIAAEHGLEVVWEFEPGFIVNEPKNILKTYADVNEPNFKILFDTCHGYMAADKAANHLDSDGPLPGGIMEFIEMLNGKIGIVHVIDSDGTLNGENTSTHAPFGQGDLDFDKIIPALLDNGYTADWWAIDLCEWPDPMKVTAECKAFVDKFNEKYCK